MGHTDTLNGDFLVHYGVKGMKWGVIRDAAAAGAKSAGRGVGKAAKSASTNPQKAGQKAGRVALDLRKTGVRSGAAAKEYIKTSSDHSAAQKVKLKQKVAGVQTLSNKDLQIVIARMNLEMQYKNLKKAEFEDSYLGAGGKFVTSILKDAATDAASSWIKRPGSNFSGRTTSRVASSLGGAVTQRRAIGA